MFCPDDSDNLLRSLFNDSASYHIEENGDINLNDSESDLILTLKEIPNKDQ